MSAAPRIACFATQGSGHRDEERIRTLLAPLGPTVLPFSRASRPRAALRLAWRLARERPDLVVMEGTGVAGGVAVMLARRLAGVPYVVSSGDAVAPFVAASHPWLGRVAAAYERRLCRRSAGFIGWTPYLVGRALTLGAPRAVTAAGWAAPPPADRAALRARVRARLGIAPDALVVGIVGSLGWTDRVGYCYGAELVRAAALSGRDDLVVLIVGDGRGRARLKEMAGGMLGGRVVVPGAVPPADVPGMLAAMDLASLPQSVDGVGSFRYTTKLSEYLAAGLPVVTGRIPLAYDLDDGWLWRLPGAAPWDEAYVSALAELVDGLGAAELEERRRAVPAAPDTFSLERQRRAVCAFVADLVEGR